MSDGRVIGAWEAGRPYIVRHFLLPGLAGGLAGVACVGMMLAIDLGGLRALMFASGQAWLASPLLVRRIRRHIRGSAAIGASVMAIGQAVAVAAAAFLSCVGTAKAGACADLSPD